jgi:hypothetical protein
VTRIPSVSRGSSLATFTSAAWMPSTRLLPPDRQRAM